MKTKGKYILKGKKIVKETDLLKWAKWFESNRENCRVAIDEIDNVKVSTVFLGINHNWETGKSLLFETMIFGGKYDDYQERYSTWDEAVKGHKKAVKLVKS